MIIYGIVRRRILREKLAVKKIYISFATKERIIKERRITMINIAINNAEAKLQQLIGLTKGMKLDAADLNGDKAKQAYIEEKYSK